MFYSTQNMWLLLKKQSIAHPYLAAFLQHETRKNDFRDIDGTLGYQLCYWQQTFFQRRGLPNICLKPAEFQRNDESVSQ